MPRGKRRTVTAEVLERYARNAEKSYRRVRTSLDNAHAGHGPAHERGDFERLEEEKHRLHAEWRRAVDALALFRAQEEEPSNESPSKSLKDLLE